MAALLGTTPDSELRSWLFDQRLLMKLLTILRPKELPQWATASSVAVYCPSTRTIYVRADFTGTKYAEFLVHELGHWLIDLLTTPLKYFHQDHIRHRIQQTYDDFDRILSGRSHRARK